MGRRARGGRRAGAGAAEPGLSGPGLAPAPDGAPGARTFSYRYGKDGSSLTSPPSPETVALVPKSGDTLVIPAQDDWKPQLYARGAGEKTPTAAAGTLKPADSDGQSWVWTAS